MFTVSNRSILLRRANVNEFLREKERKQTSNL